MEDWTEVIQSDDCEGVVTIEQLQKDNRKLWELVTQLTTRVEDLEMQVFPNLAGSIQQSRVQRIVAKLDADVDLMGSG